MSWSFSHPKLIAEARLREGKVLLIWCLPAVTVSSEHFCEAKPPDSRTLGRRARLPPPADRWLPSRTSGRATALLWRPIHLWSSGLNSDLSLNEGSHTQGTLGRQPCESSGDEDREARNWRHMVCTVQWTVRKGDFQEMTFDMISSGHFWDYIFCGLHIGSIHYGEVKQKWQKRGYRNNVSLKYTHNVGVSAKS